MRLRHSFNENALAATFAQFAPIRVRSHSFEVAPEILHAVSQFRNHRTGGPARFSVGGIHRRRRLHLQIEINVEHTSETKRYAEGLTYSCLYLLQSGTRFVDRDEQFDLVDREEPLNRTAQWQFVPDRLRCFLDDLGVGEIKIFGDGGFRPSMLLILTPVPLLPLLRRR